MNRIVVIFAGGMLAVLSLSMLLTYYESTKNNYTVTIETNSVGEFDLEVVMITGFLILGVYVALAGLYGTRALT